ncbi:MAG: hypothetical protein JST48_06470 [Bacteroidetes bacterium]|nr:hypothetical protein [Bacteroidota bacterium]
MLNTFLTGHKILFDGYLMIEEGFMVKSLIINHLLFDGYLTERASYPQWQAWLYLTDSTANAQAKALKPCVSARSLFDGYLTMG